MNPSDELIFGVMMLASVITLGLAYYASRFRDVVAAKRLTLLMICAAWWSGFNALEFLFPDIGWKMAVVKVEYLGIALLPIAFVGFCYRFTGSVPRNPTRNLAALLVVPAVTVSMVLTNDFHHLFYTSATLCDDAGATVLAVEYGPMFWFHVLYSQSLVITGSVMLIRMVIRGSGLRRSQAIAVLTAIMSAWVGNLIYLAGVAPYQHVDFTSIGFVLSGGAFLYAMKRYRLLDIIPVARDKLLELLPAGVIVLDAKGQVVDINPAARKMTDYGDENLLATGVSSPKNHSVIFQKCIELTDEGTSEIQFESPAGIRWLERVVTLLGNTEGTGVGKLVIFRDVTDRKRAEGIVSKAAGKLGLELAQKDKNLLRASITLWEEVLAREKVEHDLKESERLLKNIMEGMPLGIFVVDGQGKPLYFNKAFQMLTGKDSTALFNETQVGDHRSLPGAFVTGTRNPYPADRDPLMRAMSGEGSVVNDMDLCGSESTIPVEVTGAPVLDEQAEVRYAIAIYRDIREKRKAEQNERLHTAEVAFLSESAMGFVQLSVGDDIFRYIGDKLRILVPDSFVIVNSIDPNRKMLTVAAALMPSDATDAALKILGRDPVGKEYEMWDEAIENLKKKEILRVKGGLHTLTFGEIPKVAAAAAELIHGIGDVYSMGFSGNDEVYGNAVLLLRKGAMLKNKTAVETFINQASAALQKRLAEKQVRKSLKEKDVLLREVHHRVKNNLQIIISLLNLQSADVLDPAVKKMFLDAQTRVRSLSLLHERIYSSRDLSKIDLSIYIRELTGDLLRFHGQAAQNITIDVKIDEVAFEMETIIPVGLLVTELVSNCIKHAFPPGRKGTVTIALRELGDNDYQLSVKDDGAGLPEGFDPGASKSLGMQLICGLAEQLGGKLEVVRNGSTGFSVRFRKLEYPRRM